MVGRKNPNARIAYSEANYHYQQCGHSVTVQRGWRANCHRCKLRGPTFQRHREALAWWNDHARTDQRHLQLLADAP